MHATLLAVNPRTGLGLGLLLTVFGFGFRHGIDWDHIAALTDITGSQEQGRRSMVLASLYALGHALVVFVLGVLAIVLSAEVPGWLDGVMERVVGGTLLLLGGYMLVALLRHGRDFRMRSRWMLLFAAVRCANRWARGRRGPDVVVITHEHEHPIEEHHDVAHEHEHELVQVARAPRGAVAHRASIHHHVHSHVAAMPADPFPRYGRPTAFLVGMLHGVGAETPTQVLVLLAAAGAGGAVSGILVLSCFLAGLLASNTAVALMATFGFLRASRRFRVYATVSVVTAVGSLLVGMLFLLGRTAVLPALTG